MPLASRTLCSVLAAMWALGFGALLPALAQVSTPEQQRTLDRMRAAPLDHENTFEYVKASVAVRDYEAAIAALERLLVYNPALSRVKYELGVLYHRMGSYALAVRYFEDAAADKDIDEPLRRRIEAYLPDAQKQLRASRWSGLVMAGLRYNSNVAGAPDGGLIRSFGLDVALGAANRGRGDTSAVALADISHVYDFRTARQFTWETGFAGYGSAQFRETDLSGGLFEISTGPRFAIFSDPLIGVTLRPYAVGGSSMVDGRSYVSSLGGGASLSVPVGAFVTLSPSIEGRAIHVNNPAVFGNLGTTSTGSLVTGALAGRWLVMDGVTLDSRARYARNNADNAVETNAQWGIDASLKIDFAPPTERIGVNWSVTGFARYTATRFDDPNPTVDPNITRRDNQVRLGLQLDMPYSPNFGFSLLGQHTRNDSNLANFRSDAWSIMLGHAYRF